MADNHENVFGEEAQEEVIISEAQHAEASTTTHQSKRKMRTNVEEEELDGASEDTPLINDTDGDRRHQTYNSANNKFDRTTDILRDNTNGGTDLPWHKTPSIKWLLPAFFPFCIAFGGLIVPRTYLILNLICKQYLAEQSAKDPMFHYIPVDFGAGENPQCDEYHVQQRTAYFNTYVDLITGILSAIVTSYVGTLSDRVGRKKVMVLASVGGLVNEIITIIVGTNAGNISVYWLLLGSIADGLSGSFTAGMTLAFAYTADCTPPEKRAVAFGYFQGTLFTGIALGPIFASYLIQLAGNVMIVFYVTLGCHLFFILFTFFIVPESLSKERQKLAQEKYALEQAKSADKTWVQVLKKTNILEPLWILWPTGEGSSPSLRKNLFILAAIDTMMFGVAMGTMRVILIYAKFRFHWTAVLAGKFLTSCNVLRVLCLVLLLPLLNKVFKGTDRAQRKGHQGSSQLDINIIRVSIIFDLIGYLGYALAPSGAVMVVSGLVASVGGIGSPTLQSSITKHVPADRTGQVLGATGLLHALSRVVAPTIFNLIYGLTVKYYAGIVFFCLASVFVVVFVLSWLLKPHVYLEDTTTLSPEIDQNKHDDDTSSS